MDYLRSKYHLFRQTHNAIPIPTKLKLLKFNNTHIYHRPIQIKFKRFISIIHTLNVNPTDTHQNRKQNNRFRNCIVNSTEQKKEKKKEKKQKKNSSILKEEEQNKKEITGVVVGLALRRTC